MQNLWIFMPLKKKQQPIKRKITTKKIVAAIKPAPKKSFWEKLKGKILPKGEQVAPKQSDYLYYKAIWSGKIQPSEYPLLAAYCLFNNRTQEKSYICIDSSVKEKSCARFEIEDSTLENCEKHRLLLKNNK